MKKFLAIYHAPAAALAQMENMTAEQKAKGMEPWMKWNAKVGDQMVDFGAPCMGGQSLNPAGVWSASDKEVSGYTLVQANSLADAQSLFADHPHLSWAPGCSIELHECLAM